MTSPAEDIKDMLVYESALGLDFAVDLFTNKEPSKPDECVTIFDTGGYPDYLGLTDTNYQYPSIQIRVRSKKYLTGWALANNIKTLLHGRARQTWNGSIYELIRCVNGPMLLDWDDNNNCRIVLNFNLQRKAV
jgi:hypothetical protein